VSFYLRLFRPFTNMSERILYIEATSGASGDMLLGAFLDLGVPVELIAQAWDALGIDNYEVEVFETQKSAMRALQCRVRTEEQKGPKSWKQYRSVIEKSKVPETIRTGTLDLVKKLFQIESQIHGIPMERLHLHEMGGTDLLIDVVGSLTAIEYLQPAHVWCSAINTGRGFFKFSHGSYPVPSPATTKLLEGMPIFQNEVEGELTTPTGALLLKHMAKSFGNLPAMNLINTGVGAGEKEIPNHPNVLRMFLGTTESAGEDIHMLETNIDDSSAQILGYFMERAFAEGALDVFFTPIFMKKNRPAIRLTILSSSRNLDAMMKLVFSETTAIGFRHWKVDRKTLERRWSEVEVEKQKIRIKESYLDGTLYNYQPEFEDCKKAAQKLKRPLKEIVARAIHQYVSKQQLQGM
jgi:pyridinium-3,5-bisthiocarboxylic acid mononucleotide nickel chelatase